MASMRPPSGQKRLIQDEPPQVGMMASVGPDEGVENQLGVQRDNDAGHDPGHCRNRSWNDEPTHFAAIGDDRISGMTAKGSCIERITWLNTNSSAVPLSPYSAVTTTTGMMARPRVIRRRAQPGIRSCRNPSITIWPASVVVTVEFRPDARRATANRIEAIPRPRSGYSNRYASPIFATSVWPLE